MSRHTFWSVLLVVAMGCGAADPEEATPNPERTANTAVPAIPANEAAGAENGDDPAAAGAGPAAEATEARPAAPSAETADEPVFDPPTAGERVSIPAGTLLVGSRPGTRYRQVRFEADLQPLSVPAFEIDRLPYPNDGSSEVRTDVSRPEAQSLCEARGGRLCDELEWERACKGGADRAYVTGAEWSAEACAGDHASCTSPVGVSSLGARVAEWTANRLPRAMRREAQTWVIRGASADEPDARHRCARRGRADPSAPSRRIGFRCCYGGAADLTYPAASEHERHTLVEADDAALRGYLSQMPEVARFADGFAGFGENAARAVLERGEKTEEDLAGWRPFTGVMQWVPLDGEFVWVFAGRTSEASLIVVAHPMPDGSLVHGASFVTEGENPEILVAWSPGTPNALKWSTCWECAGEGGVIMLRDGRVTIAQR